MTANSEVSEAPSNLKYQCTGITLLDNRCKNMILVKSGIACNKDNVRCYAHKVIDADSDITCAICLEQIEGQLGKTIQRTKCNHFFHKACLQTWLDKSSNCPCCRYLLHKSHKKTNTLPSPNTDGPTPGRLGRDQENRLTNLYTRHREIEARRAQYLMTVRERQQQTSIWRWISNIFKRKNSVHT